MMLFLILVVHIQSHRLRSPEKPLKLAVVSYYEQEGGVLSNSENTKNNKDNTDKAKNNSGGDKTADC
jgi:hypothetical protein